MCSLVLNADDKARVSKGSLWPVTRTSNERRNNLSQCIYGLGYQKVSVLGRWHMKRVLFLFRNGLGSKGTTISLISIMRDPLRYFRVTCHQRLLWWIKINKYVKSQLLHVKLANWGFCSIVVHSFALGLAYVYLFMISTQPNISWRVNC